MMQDQSTREQPAAIAVAPAMTPEQAAKLQHMLVTCHQVYVETNPHHTNYQTVSAYVASEQGAAEEFIGTPEDGRILYSLHVYPDTPVGSYRVLGHDIGALIDEMEEALR